MDSTTKQQVILAAVTAAGPVVDGDVAGWNVSVEQNAARIALMLQPESKVAAVLDALAEAKPFAATITNIEKEESSTRAFVTIKTGTDREAKGLDKQVLPAGHEIIRSERTDNPSGQAMAKRLRSLVGHKVLIYKKIEKFEKGDGTLRVVAHVEDLGVDPAYAANPAA